jgi:hypothetical protein
VAVAALPVHLPLPTAGVAAAARAE